MKKDKKIILAKNAGFCFGVRRAIDLAERALEKRGRAYCLGSIIHNPQVVKRLKKRGMRFVENISRVPAGSIFIVRSHGVEPKVIESLKKKNVKIIDATCPFVGKAQLAAKKFYDEGREVLIFGDRNHAEVVGINGYAGNSAQALLEVKNIKKLKKDRIGILSQTTQKKDLFKKFIQDLKKISKDVKIADTICNDSSKKKEEVKKIARRVELMIVIGGKESNNTRKLAEVSRSAGAKTHHIETAEEIDPAWLKGTKKIGIAAGASTPDWIIAEVISAIGK